MKRIGHRDPPDQPDVLHSLSTETGAVRDGANAVRNGVSPPAPGLMSRRQQRIANAGLRTGMQDQPTGSDPTSVTRWRYAASASAVGPACPGAPLLYRIRGNRRIHLETARRISPPAEAGVSPMSPRSHGKQHVGGAGMISSGRASPRASARPRDAEHAGSRACRGRGRLENEVIRDQIAADMTSR